jgi:hypothetical protein
MAVSPHSARTGRLAPIIRQFWRLLEFTRDIDRNEDDTLFARNGGTIIYVLDENVFEFFIKPQSFSRYAELFHSNIWFEGEESSEDLRRISAQSALVASEYIFSGELPGQKDRTTYMTEWHFGELSNRRAEYTSQLRDEIGSLSRNPSPNSALHKDPALDFSEIDDLTRSDSDKLANRTEDEAALRRFQEARVAARQLARSNYLGPMHQLKRIGSRDIAGRIVPLGARYRPAPDEREAIRDNRWNLLKLLREEQRRRDEARERRSDDQAEHSGGRSDRTLQNDADALAYIIWIARNKLASDERIVLVTGDSLLFDVYRSWYLDQPIDEPFILRRISQFAPIINLNDARSDIVDRRELFRETREAVEAALFVFNLSGSGNASDQLLKGREYLALALSRYRDSERDPGLASFLTGLTGKWMEERKNDFANLIHLWQQLERFVIGVHYEVISQRFPGADQTRLRDVIATGGQEAYVHYLKELLDELVSGSIRLFFPFAAEFIRSIAGRDIRRSRVPIALRLSIPTPEDSESRDQADTGFNDVHELFALWRDRDETAVRLLDIDQNPTLAQRPDLVYAIAAALALEAGEWRDAERFADLACAADPMMSMPAEELEEAQFESVYLSAIAKRFRIGSLDPTTSQIRFNIWRDLLHAAEDHLTRCELHHARKAETRRQMRAISERAAARLFYVSWAAVISLEEFKARQFALEDAVESFGLALADLRRCLELEAGARDGAPGDERRKRFFQRLERQYITNLAAAHVLKRLFAAGPLKTDVEGLRDDEIELVSARIEQWAADDLPLPAKGDLLAFKAVIHSDPHAAGQFTEWLQKKPRFDLALDRAVTEAYAKALPELIK